MKRARDILEENPNIQRSVSLVELNPEPSGLALVNPRKVSKKTHIEMMELESHLTNANSHVASNARNKLEIIGRQMKNLQELMTDVIRETNLNHELNGAACNFVKKPGNVYHLYERPSGQKYFGMLSPEEWINTPHKFLGSYRLEADYSWTPAGDEETRHEGINFLREIVMNPKMKSIMDVTS
ncbi:unnamed protein product [Phaedon cochleariae]|uniref:DUF2452 domain-containing protein n=1 Tax=Phaedon cochleariae TaxID=80249 RepID=A0A9P0DSA3_PHACE|nr:unnamed protein product [Phaedon cochleariae]